jgi:hypothetical protein
MPDPEERFVSATKYVQYGDRGFWVYDIVLGVFVKHLVDVVEATEHSRAAFLDAALRHWRLTPFLDIGVHFEKSWTELQRQNVIAFLEEACDRLGTRDSIPMEEIVNWTFGGDLRLFHRGLMEVRTAPVIELGTAIIALLRDELPQAPEAEAWFFTHTGRSTIGMQTS